MFHLHLNFEPIDTRNSKTFWELILDTNEFAKIDPDWLAITFDPAFLPDLSEVYPALDEEEIYTLNILHSEEYQLWKDEKFTYYPHKNDWNEQLLISHWRLEEYANDEMLDTDFTISCKHCDYSNTLADQLINRAFEIGKSSNRKEVKGRKLQKLFLEAMELFDDISFSLYPASVISEKIQLYINLWVLHSDQ